MEKKIENRRIWKNWKEWRNREEQKRKLRFITVFQFLPENLCYESYQYYVPRNDCKDKVRTPME